ncbi:hypothetical protein ANO11243_090960 [Dothideomycetidae sp. 11243]|nr:hypothetical protein ANO11243_090960 [fungal sp. No.11243]
MTYTLKGRNVLVTGGTRGIGEAIVRRFAAEGSNIAINYLSSGDVAASLATSLQASHGIKAVTIQADMALASDAKRLIHETISALGGLDIIVSNAGNTKIAAYDDIHALSEADWDHAYALFVKANVFMAQAALSTFQSNQDGGVLLLMSSSAGLVAAGSSMAYSVTRAAENHLAKGLAKTLGPKVRVNAVCPGLVDTERAKGLGEERREGHKDMAVLKKLTTPEEVADVFVMLARNTGMTGEVVKVDSGMFVGS